MQFLLYLELQNISWAFFDDLFQALFLVIKSFVIGPLINTNEHLVRLKKIARSIIHAVFFI